MTAVTARQPGREHIPEYPKGYIAVNIIQLIFSLIVIGTSGFSLAVGGTIGGVFLIISSVVSFAVSIWLIAARTCAPQAFNYWASIAFDVFLFLFYLIGWACTAVVSIYWMGTIFGVVNAVAAVFGAFNWIMFIVALIVDAIVVARHRRAGLRNKPGLPVAANAAQQPKEQYQMTPQAYPAQPVQPIQPTPAFQPANPNGQYYAPQAVGQPQPVGQPQGAGQVPQYTVPTQQPHY